MLIRGTIAVTCLAILTACGPRDPEPAPLLSILDGVYDAQLAAGCVALEFTPRGRRDYLFDADCDGVAEIESDAVEIVDDEIRVPGAVITVEAVGANSFSGVLSAGETAEAVRFTRRVEDR